ncbi:GAF domain-containing protein [Algoriphagus hitonicola]|uniref:histidine kinase n=1 Tax=Algoriphagus hitonicola TaxID=435880 RepID=A0A1I2NWC2_9BACT|nr:GAF domain-containing protein [Algoriphagus hitonicola]SFG05561.1 GAF domain-containing protein [Algoriphagus hitonicola]
MNRIEDLKSYNILDTDPEQELDELTQIASAIFDTPMSIISFIDDKRQWYKSKLGTNETEVAKEETFCQFLLDKPNDLLIVRDAQNDEKFKYHPHVTCENGIKFYVGVPLVSKKGNVLGTVCVVDYELRDEIPEHKFAALRLIAKRIMMYLETRKLVFEQGQEIEYNAYRLKKLTDLAPGAIFKLSVDSQGEIQLVFISEGIKKLIPELTKKELKKDPKIIFDYINEKDNEKFKRELKKSFKKNTPISIEYQVKSSDGEEKFHWMRANPKSIDEKTIHWYGIIQDISSKMNQLKVFEKILFDISHVIRKPTANIQGISEILHSQSLDIEEKESFCDIIVKEVDQLDKSISELNEKYFSLKDDFSKNWKKN